MIRFSELPVPATFFPYRLSTSRKKMMGFIHVNTESLQVAEIMDEKNIGAVAYGAAATFLEVAKPFNSLILANFIVFYE